MKKTYQEILDILKEKIDEVSDFAHEDYEPANLGLGEIIEVYQYGGEGDGDHWESVKLFKDHDVYIQVVGHYQSYNGTDFNGWNDACKQVQPIDEVVTVYKSIQ